jgi:hypothetical protein
MKRLATWAILVACSLEVIASNAQAQCGDGACVRTGTSSPSVIGTSSIGGAVTGLLANLELQITGLGGLLSGPLTTLLNTVVGTALKLVGGLLGTTLTSVLASVVDPALASLGVHYGSVDVTVSQVYVIPPGSTCEDGQYCTMNDTCDGSKNCVGVSRTCADAYSCTADSCNEAIDRCDNPVTTGCLINGACLADNVVDTNNTCRACVAGTSTTAWTLLALGAGCNDGQDCTSNDACTLLGACVGTPLICNDNLACTLDVCNEANDRCDSTLLAGCLIDGVCRGIAADEPNNACRNCNPGASTTEWSNRFRPMCFDAWRRLHHRWNVSDSWLRESVQSVSDLRSKLVDHHVDDDGRCCV